ncbi:amidase [Bradyrhizobium sp. Leo170]|uniref:amidase n=1 Tax=Bradyrhizobium sp. Leo170 TaxID=1571199 RepID=UPI00102E6EA8|nr:amidase [Bradyrhizobium sp. Leo170]TAI64842.1 amidase [Bradyrhizobium sp. Leo170]
MQPEILNLDATELVARFRKRELSPVEAISAVLERAEATQTTLNAFIVIGRDAALAAARESEKRWRAGAPLGGLDGVPVSIKDNVYAHGWPTRFGSLAIAESDTRGPDSPCVARLHEAGAVIFGKTTLPDYAHKIVTDSPLTRITRNPWNPAHSPGGSSGGAAAAVASGIGPLAVGTDGGGSIRVPAAWSGIYGLKPSFGRVPHHPRGAFPTVSHIGPMTRSVRDAAAMLDIMSRPDPHDWYALPYDSADYTADIDRGIDGLRVAVSDDLGMGVDIEPEIAASVRAAFKVAESLGAQIEADHPAEIPACADVHRVHWFSFSARLGRKLSERVSQLDPSMQALVQMGEKLPAGAFVDAVVARGDLASRINIFFERYDLLLAPVMNISAPEIASLDPANPPFPTLTSWVNQAGLPAASVPCGLTSAGLPIGLQIIAGPRADALVLRASYALEQALGRLKLPR